MNLAGMLSTIVDADDRAYMRLIYLGGHTVKEIAECFGLTERVIYHHTHRARAELQERFPDYSWRRRRHDPDDVQTSVHTVPNGS